MAFTLFFLVLFVAVLLIDIFVVYDSDYSGSWIFGVIFFIMVIWIPVNHYIYKVQFDKFESRRQTVVEQRNNPQLTEYERATLTQEIYDDNSWLAAGKRHATGKMFNWYVPKEILEIEPIK
jgi:hypothetical protein